MVKKIIHLADLHFKMSPKTHSQYREVLGDMMLDIKKNLEKENLEYNEVRIALLGDIFHNKLVISNEQQEIISWFLDEMEKIAPVIMICGNHDTMENNRDKLDSLSNLIKLKKPKNTKFLDMELGYKSGCYEDENIVWCLYSIFDEYNRPNIEEIKEKSSGDKTYIGLFHFPLIGSKNDMGYQMEHGQFLNIFFNLDFVLGGDIHKFQVLENDGIKIVYPSSTIQQDQGESVENHFYLMWDVKNKDFEKYKVNSEYGIYKFKITSMDELENGKEELVNL